MAEVIFTEGDKSIVFSKYRKCDSAFKNIAKTVIIYDSKFFVSSIKRLEMFLLSWLPC